MCCWIRIIEKNLITARGVYGLFPANAVGDDVELYTDKTREKVLQRFHFLRQQSNKEGSEPCRSLVDFIAPKETGLSDHIGAFAVTSGIGLKELCDRFRAENDDYNAIMAEALADRLAEAFAECLHKQVRCEWGYGCKEGLSNADLIAEKYRGIRPAAGYPACPDHTEKGPLWRTAMHLASLAPTPPPLPATPNSSRYAAAPPETKPWRQLLEIKSPTPGTFYAEASPRPPFVSVGSASRRRRSSASSRR